jgi:hypothetical protein
MGHAQDYLCEIPGRKRKSPYEEDTDDHQDSEEIPRKKSKEEKAQERKRKSSDKKDWSLEKRRRIVESVRPFVVKHAKEMKKYIEATHT